MAKVEMLIQVCINGRPIWRKARAMRNEMSYRMTDKEYDKVLIAATTELASQINTTRPKEEALSK